jgi:hypothetical protein
MKAAFDRKLAVLVGQHPGGLHRKCHRWSLVLGVVGEADRRPEHPPAALGDHLLHRRVAILGFGLEDAAERRLGVSLEDRPIELAVIFDQDRLVVGDELRAEADAEKNKKQPQRPEAAPVELEHFPAPSLQGREPEPPLWQPCGGYRLDDRGVGRRVHAAITLRGSRNRCADRPTYR